MANEQYMIVDFNRGNIEQFYQNISENDFLCVWTPKEIELLSEISPLTVKRINEKTGSNFKLSRSNLEEQSKSLAAFLTLSIDNSVFKGIMRPDIVRSKIRHLNKIYEATGKECPIEIEDVNDMNCIEFAYITKKLALSHAKNFNRDFENRAKMQVDNRLGFEGQVADLFGENLERIIQYGSSVNGNGKDIDLMLFLKKFTINDYYKINGKRESIVSDKPVSIVLLPSDALSSYAECDYHSLTIAKEGRLVFGKPLDFPVLTEEESVKKMYFKAGKEITSLRGALSDFRRQEKMYQSPEFLRETLKLEIWARKALLQREINKYLSKEEFLELEPIPAIRQANSIQDVKSMLYDSNCRIKERIDIHLDRL